MYNNIYKEAQGPWAQRAQHTPEQNIFSRLASIEKYNIYEVDGDIVGQQYPSDTGPIDILSDMCTTSEIVHADLMREFGLEKVQLAPYDVG